MRVNDMFKKDINRSINGVIKVAQDDVSELEQELGEYVITDELRGQLEKFLVAYERSLDAPTDKIGVWISGFFGSGKSHFLKMLSYLLSNKAVNGKTVIQYFQEKLADAPELLAKLQRVCSVPGESILFNIDSMGSAEKNSDTAVLRVFYKVFHEHLGYYGEDMKLARLERYIEDKGKTNEFRAVWKELTGESWLVNRDTYDFEADSLVEALGRVFGMSEETARNWVDGSTQVDYSIDTFVDEVRAYIEKKKAENGGQFRLLFCVDEVGQYIGDNVSLMLNLQTIVEDLGARCTGDAWVMVTSQQAIDEVTDIKGNDFSKIQGRFDTRLALSGSSAREVIRRRLLEKTPVATDTLAAEYASSEQVLKNLFTFKDAKGDLKGFASAFPFVGYQFTLLQDVYNGVRRHGSSGKNMSSASRSMLSGFQEAARAVQSGDETTLVPFWRFYDTLAGFLEVYISDVVGRCARQATAGDQGLLERDVPVLKLLFLLKYVSSDMPANLDNLAILMADSVDPDITATKAGVQESLDRLYR